MIIMSSILVMLGMAGSIWGISHLSIRYAWGKYWFTGLFIALIGALPELLMSLMANGQGLGVVAFGTPLGSGIVNILLLGGLAATISPTEANKPFPIKGTWGVIIAVLLLMGTAAMGKALSSLHTYTIPRWGGAGLIVAYAAITFLAYREGLSTPHGAPTPSRAAVKTLWPCLSLMAGITLVGLGAYFAATAALARVAATGSGQNAIGLLGLALIAALPETTAVLYLASRRQTATAFYELLHSTTANLLLILGCAALIAPIPAYDALPADLGFVLLGALLVLGAIALGKGKRVSRGEGIALMLFYCLVAAFVLLRQDWGANLFF